jgi:O-antigen/teichoic acid export membrane protein
MASTALRDVFKLISGSLLAKLFSTAALMLFARSLPKEEMAVFPAFLMLAGMANTILTFGLFANFTRRLPSLIRTDPDLARSIVVTGTGIIVAGTLLPSAAAYVWSDTLARIIFERPASGWIIQIMVPGFLAYMMSRIEEYVMWGRGQFGASSLIQILESIVRPVATVACWLWLGFPGIVIALVVSQIVMAAIGLWYIRDMFFAGPVSIYPVRRLIWESMSYYAGNYLSFFRGDGDSLLVTLFLGPAALAEYYVAKTLYTNVSLICTAVDKVAAERLARDLDPKVFADKAVKLHEQICSTFVPFCMLVIATAPGAMIVLAGAKYADATWPAIVLLVAMLVQFVSIPFDRAVYISLPGWIRLKYTTIEAVAAVAAVAILAPFAGLLGVSVARIVAPLGVCIFGAVILKRHLGVVLPAKPLVLAIALSTPGTIVALLAMPTPHTIVQAIWWSGLGALVWIIFFLGLVYVFNRPLLEEFMLVVRNRLRPPGALQALASKSG